MKKIFNTEIIERYLKENDISKKEFCLACKIPLSTLNKIFKHNTDFDIVHLFRLAFYLNIEVKDLFQKNEPKDPFFA